MSIAKTVAINTGIQLGGKIISLLLGLAAIALITRTLGVEQFGFYTTITTFLSVFGVLADFGLVLVSAQLLTTHHHDQEKLFGTLLSVRLISALLFIGLAPLLVWLFPYPHIVKIGVMINAIAFIAIALQQICTGLFQKYLVMHYQVIAELMGRLALLTGIALVITLHQSFIAMLIAITTAQLIQIIISLIFATKITRIHFSLHKKYVRMILEHAWPIGLGILFNTIYLRGDALILSLTRSQTEVGLYGASYRILDIVTQLPIMFMGVMLPILSKAWATRDIPTFTRMLQKTFECIMLIAFPVVAGAIILAQPIMQLIGGSAFTVAAPIAAILSCACIGGFLGALFGHINVAINRQKQALWVYACTAVIASIGYIFTIPRFGMYGAATTTVVSETIAGILLYYTVIRYTDVHLRIWSFINKVILATMFMAIILMITPQLPLPCMIVLGMVVYGVSVYMLGMISKKDLGLILK